jgi:NADPH-dependent ferric siderophore reductase
MSAPVARSLVGERVALTSLERDLASNAVIPMHHAHVVSVDSVTPSLLTVDLGGLEQFETLGPDTFAFALISGDGTPLAPDFTIDQYQNARVEGRVRGAYYTVRRFDPDRGVLTVWVVVHGDGDGVAAWMQASRPGDGLLLWGPRRGFVPPADADHLLLASDETGFAAVASLIEDAGEDVVIEAVLEVIDPTHRPPLPDHPRLSVHWIDRGETIPGAGDGLVDAVRAIDTSSGTWAAFGAAESRVATHVRQLLRERGIPATHVSSTGYWRQD